MAIAKEVIFSKITEVSKDFGVSEAMLTYMVLNEAKKTPRGDFLPCGDGDTHLTDLEGNPHQSRGILQINKFYHPEVSDEQAYNPSFALEWTASRLRQGYCKEWTTCRAYMKKIIPSES